MPAAVRCGRRALRGLAALAAAVAVLVGGASTALAACGQVALAHLDGDWQLRVTFLGYTGVPLFTHLAPGHTGISVLHIATQCTAPGACTVALEPLGQPGQQVFDNATGFSGPPNAPALFPFLQSGATATDVYPPNGIGGPNLPPCNDPFDTFRYHLTLRVTGATQDAGGAWQATAISGTYVTPESWTCNGSTGVLSAIGRFTLAAVRLTASFPANIDDPCAIPASPVASASAHAAASPAASPPANPAQSTLATALASPHDAFSSPTQVAVNLLITFGVLLFITFPAHLFNSTFEEHYDEIRGIVARRLGWLVAMRRRLAGAPSAVHAHHQATAGDNADASPSRSRDAAMFVAVMLIGAVLGGLNDPGFGFNRRSAASYLAVIVTILFGALVSTMVAVLYRRARGIPRSIRLNALPAGLLIAAACVLVSRVTDFRPGYLYGVVCGVAFSTALAKHETGHTIVLQTGITLGLGVLAWFAWIPLTDAAAHPDSAFTTIVVDDFLASLFIGGLVGSVLGLLPLRFMPGGSLLAWSRVAWAVTFAVAVFGLVDVMLRPESTSAHPGDAPIVTAIVLFVLFGGSSVAFRAYFARRARRRGGEAAAAP